MQSKFQLPKGAASVINGCKSITIPKSRQELIDLSMDGKDIREVTYDNATVEATLVRCKNGIAVNFPEDYMRRRDPDSLIVADINQTDKPTFEKKYGKSFEPLRLETFEWLKKQDLIVMPFRAGREEYSYPALLIAPKNTAFFALILADLQTFVDIDTIKGKYTPQAVFYVAPPFRDTYFNGKQVVVHNRPRENKPSHVYEMFSYNLYPGPSAKKGVYSFLLDTGEKEGWTTAHASAVKIITPYENEIVIMHEGASGGGKSEMTEPIHQQLDGRILVASNIETERAFTINLNEKSELRPISDDMAVASTAIQNESKKLVITDGENGWFVRVDHIKQYGTEPALEKLTVAPPEPLIFLNIQGHPDATALIWEHTPDKNGKPCPNPRVILPRRIVKNIISTPVEVDVRSFGVRTPFSSAKSPNYGIIGMMHVLPPAIAWLWRLVSPRGDKNPSIIANGKQDTTSGLTSEGIGSYEPFLTGSRITQANLLLEQILTNAATRYVLIPNQYIGVYHVGFMPQWISREYIARRGSAKFKPTHLIPAPCTMLGFELENLKIDGQFILQSLLHPYLQTEVGTEGYDKGAKMLTDFFKNELKKYLKPSLHPIGKQIIELCMRDAPLDDYLKIIPMRY